MARFDVYLHPQADARRRTPFLLDVQNDFIDGLQTRVVIPLRTATLSQHRLRDLNPEFEVTGKRVILDTPALAAIPVRELGKCVDNLRSRSADIQSALDCLFGAY
jgi:toxin CcdB